MGSTLTKEQFQKRLQEELPRVGDRPKEEMNWWLSLKELADNEFNKAYEAYFANKGNSAQEAC